MNLKAIAPNPPLERRHFRLRFRKHVLTKRAVLDGQPATEKEKGEPFDALLSCEKLSAVLVPPIIASLSDSFKELLWQHPLAVIHHLSQCHV